MLISLSADKDSFKKVKFHSGLNIILAERTKDSTKKDSRNGLGKTSTIELIHFLLGGNLTNTLKKPQLEDWTFTLDLNLSNKIYSISRRVSNRNKIIIRGDCSKWSIKPEDDSEGNQVLSNEDWKKILGSFMFGLKRDYSNYKYFPTFRSCFAYFARLDQNGGFQSPFKQYSSQLEWDIQVNNSFLLGLDWTYASKWQILKDRKKILSQLKTEAESGILREMHGSLGELEAERISLENSVKQQKEQLSNFKVHPQYHKIEDEANNLTALIHDYVNENITDKTLLKNYEQSIKEEKEPESEKLEKIYQKAGIVIPPLIKKRFEDVRQFHKNIIENRKDFLKSEIFEIKSRLNRREKNIKDLSEKRVDLLNLLKRHGALEEYTSLQSRFTEMISELENVKRKIENMKQFEEGQSKLKIDLELIQQKARIAMEERKEIRDKVISLFNSNSQKLYASPGILSIDVKESGYKFGVDIKREGSHGINNMEIFCYDLMKMQLLSEGKNSPNLLIHDSIIFADVDERQVANALELGKNESENKNFQYICTFNSDNIPQKDFSKDFNFEKYVILKLTDKDEKGGLFGLRF